jgi:hypothetical protein
MPTAPHPSSKLGPWKILLVDDEPDIHDVTKLTLHRFQLDGRRLQFFDAYSGPEAKAILSREPDIERSLTAPSYLRRHLPLCVRIVTSTRWKRHVVFKSLIVKVWNG